MNCVELYWNIDLPAHFIVDHPIGTVLGKAKYGDYLSVYQGVTVGGNVNKSGEWIYPQLGSFVTLYSHSSVLGNSIIGNHVIFSANSFVFNETIPNNSIVFGRSPNLTIKTYSEAHIKEKLVKEWALS